MSSLLHMILEIKVIEPTMANCEAAGRKREKWWKVNFYLLRYSSEHIGGVISKTEFHVSSEFLRK